MDFRDKYISSERANLLTLLTIKSWNLTKVKNLPEIRFGFPKERWQTRHRNLLLPALVKPILLDLPPHSGHLRVF